MITAGLVATFGFAAPASAAPHPAPAAPATGDFTAAVDFATLESTDLPGERCQLTVGGTLTFTGTLTGAAEGTTTAIVFAPCTEVQSNPPGTFRDIFRFNGEYEGTVDGVATTGPLTYFGVTAPGGDIRAAIRLNGDNAEANLRAEATVAVGGSYVGVAKQRR
jgi:hypothetical protein